MCDDFFDWEIDADELALMMGISEEMAEEERERLKAQWEMEREEREEEIDW